MLAADQQSAHIIRFVMHPFDIIYLIIGATQKYLDLGVPLNKVHGNHYR